MAFSFNSTPAQKPAPFAFGSSGVGGFGTTATNPSTGFAFGSAAPPASTSAFSFGPTSTPSAQQSFGFGSALPTSSTTTSTFGFGAPATTSAPPAFNFGSATSTQPPAFGAASTNPTFGSISAAPTIGFGSIATTSSAPSFGGFGMQSGGGLITAPASTAPPSFGFGAPSSSQSSGFGFGAPASSGTLSLGFGATNTTPSMGFGATSIANSLNLGGTLTSSSLGFGGVSSAPSAFGLSTSMAPTSTSTFGFGPSTSSALGAPSFSGFNQIGATATSASGPFGGLGGQPGSFQLGGLSSVSTTTTTATPSAGLGGTLFPPANGGSAQAPVDVKTESKALRELAIPNELYQMVEDLKKHVKDEKSISSDIIHVSPKIYEKINSQSDGLRRLVTLAKSDCFKQKHQLEKLKKDISEAILNAEIAQRTRDAPPGLQFENLAPQEFFIRLVTNFELQMANFRRQIEETEAHFQSMAAHDDPEHLFDAIRKIHDVVVGLAAKYQPIHDGVKKEKEFCSILHRHTHGTNATFFADRQMPIVRSQNVPTTVGPSPFSGQVDGFALARATMALRPTNQTLVTVGPPTLGLGVSSNSIGFGGQPSLFSSGQTSFMGGSNTLNSSTLGNTSSNQGIFGATMSPFSNNNQTSFQTSGKRGKH